MGSYSVARPRSKAPLANPTIVSAADAPVLPGVKVGLPLGSGDNRTIVKYHVAHLRPPLTPRLF